MQWTRKLAGAAAIGITALAVTPALSAPLMHPQGSTLASTQTGANNTLTQVRWRGGGGWHGGGWHHGGWHGGWHRGGWGWGPAFGGFAAGALIGSAIASSAAPYPYYGAPVYDAAPDSSVAYCQQRFRSYDPASGTYLGYDGLRHPCP
jgi:hypothetical protein